MEEYFNSRDWVDFGFIRYRREAKEITIDGESLWDLECRLLDDVGTLLSERRPIRVEELIDAAKWRGLSRANFWIEKNDPKFIQEVSRIAFSKDTANFLRHHVLMMLKGVGLVLASAVVTMYDQFNYTPIDQRTKGSLVFLQRWIEKDPHTDTPWDHQSGHGYMEFTRNMCEFASELNTELRNLDRALNQWYKDTFEKTGKFLSLEEWEEIADN